MVCNVGGRREKVYFLCVIEKIANAVHAFLASRVVRHYTISAMGGVTFRFPAFFRKISLSLSHFFRFASYSS